MSNSQYKSPFDTNVGELTVEEVIERLRKMGIEPNLWVDNEDRVKDGDKARLPSLTHYAELLRQMGSLIETQVKNDVKEMDQLVYQLRRLEKGIGKKGEG